MDTEQNGTGAVKASNHADNITEAFFFLKITLIHEIKVRNGERETNFMQEKVSAHAKSHYYMFLLGPVWKHTIHFLSAGPWEGCLQRCWQG